MIDVLFFLLTCVFFWDAHVCKQMQEEFSRPHSNQLKLVFDSQTAKHIAVKCSLKRNCVYIKEIVSTKIKCPLTGVGYGGLAVLHLLPSFH